MASADVDWKKRLDRIEEKMDKMSEVLISLHDSKKRWMLITSTVRDHGSV